MTLGIQEKKSNYEFSDGQTTAKKTFPKNIWQENIWQENVPKKHLTSLARSQKTSDKKSQPNKSIQISLENMYHCSNKNTAIETF